MVVSVMVDNNLMKLLVSYQIAKNYHFGYLDLYIEKGRIV